MEFYGIELSDESIEIVDSLRAELRELKLTSLALDIAIKMLKSAEIEEVGNRLSKPIDVNTIISNFHQN